jgi:hypothetical protein
MTALDLAKQLENSDACALLQTALDAAPPEP